MGCSIQCCSSRCCCSRWVRHISILKEIWLLMFLKITSSYNLLSADLKGQIRIGWEGTSCSLYLFCRTTCNIYTWKIHFLGGFFTYCKCVAAGAVYSFIEIVLLRRTWRFLCIENKRCHSSLMFIEFLNNFVFGVPQSIGMTKSCCFLFSFFTITSAW